MARLVVGLFFWCVCGGGRAVDPHGSAEGAPSASGAQGIMSQAGVEGAAGGQLLGVLVDNARRWRSTGLYFYI